MQLTSKDNIESELLKGRTRLEVSYTKLEDVLQSHSDNAINFGKSRDVEAVSALGKTLLEMQREIRQTNSDLFKKDDPKAIDPKHLTQNNIILSGDMRDVLNAIDMKNDKQ